MMHPPNDARPRRGSDDGVVGIHEVAELVGVKRATVDKWRLRGVLPEPDWDLAGGPIWRTSTIMAWTRRTGR